MAENQATNIEKVKENPVYHSFSAKKLTTSRYISPYQLEFKENDKKRLWDGILSHASVSCLVYNTDRKCILLVRQFRPVVYVNQILERQDPTNIPINNENLNDIIDWSKVDPNEAITYELCAGLCDKSKSPEETIKEEILEECGYEVSSENVHKLVVSRSGVGLMGSLHSIYYTEVTDSMKVSSGGGVADEGENIEVYELGIDKIKEFIGDMSIPKPPGLLFSLMWFLYERENYFKEKSSKQ